MVSSEKCRKICIYVYVDTNNGEEIVTSILDNVTLAFEYFNTLACTCHIQ